MNVTYSYDSTGTILTVEYAAEPSIEEWTGTMGAAMGDPRFGPGVKILLDRHRIGAPSPDFVRGVADFMSLHRKMLARCPTALVVGSKGAYGMGRMGQALLDTHGISFEIFDDLDAARLWLARQG